MAHLYDLHETEHWINRLHSRPSSAVIILETEDEKILIVKANYKSHWTFPGGIIDKGETPKQAAIREVSEEVGITVHPSVVTFRWVAVRHSSIADTYQFIFSSPLTDEMIQHITLQVSEIDDWKLVSKQDVLSEDMYYAKTVLLWAENNGEGYIEQTFGSNILM